MSKLSRFRATLVELWHRGTPLNTSRSNKDEDVYWNGEDNLYPSEIERIINNSPTASRAAKVMAKFIGGKGLMDETRDIIVNERKNYKLSNVAALGAQSIAEQNGVFFHVGFGFDDNARIIPVSLDVLDYVKCRISKEDDDEWHGKIYYRDFCKQTTSIVTAKDAKKVKWYYPFNNNQNVLRAQILADAEGEEDILKAIEHYRGQVFYLNLTPKYKYALAPVDSVYNDADSEARISEYTNAQTRTGFLGKTVALTQGLDEEESKQVKADLALFIGAENSGSLYHLDVERADSLDAIIKFIQLEPQFDDKLFVEADKRLRRNILGAFNNIPEPLILAGDGAIFGTNAEAYKAMKLFYSEQTEDERYKLSETLTYLGFPCEIKPIISPEDAITTV
jgi:hypothetical protein